MKFIRIAKIVFLFLLTLTISNCIPYPDGTTPRDKCKNADRGDSQSKKSQRDYSCSLLIIYTNNPFNDSAEAYKQRINILYQSCASDQIRLKECNNKSNLRIGLDEI